MHDLQQHKDQPEKAQNICVFSGIHKSHFTYSDVRIFCEENVITLNISLYHLVLGKPLKSLRTLRTQGAYRDIPFKDLFYRTFFFFTVVFISIQRRIYISREYNIRNSLLIPRNNTTYRALGQNHSLNQILQALY